MSSTISASLTALSPAEAAELIHHDDNIGFSGFTWAGAPKATPAAIAERAVAEHNAGRDFQIGVLTGASTNKQLDGALAAAEAIKFRAPYQSDPTLRAGINKGRIKFVDMHLSILPQMVRYGFLGDIDWAIVEAADVTTDGEIILSASVGASPTFCSQAKKIIVEINRNHPAALRGMHDIYEPLDPPARMPIPLNRAWDRIGSPVVKVDPKKIVGVVETDIEDEGASFSPLNDTTKRIGHHVAEFLAAEIANSRVPAGLLPIQSGVGDTANAVLGALGDHPDIPDFEMYTEVVQDSVVELIRKGRVKFASTCSLTLSKQMMHEVYGNLRWFRSRLLMRPQEITNHPEIVRRLGIISINTAIEVDVQGNVNSTHVMGKSLMNGIGGSGDFTRNAYISIFCCPSTAKGGKISTIVPLVSHMDHSEHSVQVVVTEHGLADLRGKDPRDRAIAIIENCADPQYREGLRQFIDAEAEGHTPFTLRAAYAMHQQFLETGDMRGVDWAKFCK